MSEVLRFLFSIYFSIVETLITFAFLEVTSKHAENVMKLGFKPRYIIENLLTQAPSTRYFNTKVVILNNGNETFVQLYFDLYKSKSFMPSVKLY